MFCQGFLNTLDIYRISVPCSHMLHDCAAPQKNKSNNGFYFTMLTSLGQF